ncbi:MAG: GNAT family N-acetyltransferase [Myxococcota bacterium]|nr:GNAT family N-acetyltransferase [Myxococcota bacterium]
MALEIREAAAVDEGRCLEMIAALTGGDIASGWAETFQALLSGSRGEVLVADESGVLLGLATVSYNLAIRYAGEYAQLEELIVDPAARGKNVGGLLVETAVERARHRGCAEFGLYLMEETERNRPFYEKYGFEFTGSEMRQRL